VAKPRGEVPQTPEATAQQKRNEELYMVVYTRESDIPPTPKEPPESALEIYDDMTLPKIGTEVPPI